MSGILTAVAPQEVPAGRLAPVAQKASSNLAGYCMYMSRPSPLEEAEHARAHVVRIHEEHGIEEDEV